LSQYIHFGIILITIPNLIVIGLMILVFALALAISLPQERAEQQPIGQQTLDVQTTDE